MNIRSALATAFPLAILITFSIPVHADDNRDSMSPYGMLAFLDWDHDWNGYFSGGDKLEKCANKIQESGGGTASFGVLLKSLPELSLARGL